LNKYRNGVLLASFLEVEEGDDASIMTEVEKIVESIPLSNNLIFLLSQVDEPNKKMLTYNTPSPKIAFAATSMYTMRVHRKKQTNTLYTINALNAAVASQHEGQTGKHLKIDWEPYANCLLLTQGKKLQSYRIEVTKIFKIEEPPEEN
jgi:hypothetical protein